MKSTYHLLGVFWDHRVESTMPLDAAPYDITYAPIGTPICLFDHNGERRTIDLTRLLSINDQNDADHVIAQLRGCSNIAVIVDYRPSGGGITQRDFYTHRLRQALRLLEDHIPHACIVLMNQPGKMGLAA